MCEWAFVYCALIRCVETPSTPCSQHMYNATSAQPNKRKRKNHFQRQNGSRNRLHWCESILYAECEYTRRKSYATWWAHFFIPSNFGYSLFSNAWTPFIARHILLVMHLSWYLSCSMHLNTTHVNNECNDNISKANGLTTEAFTKLLRFTQKSIRWKCTWN